MQKDERDLLDVLKFELDFLEKGGYHASPREPRKTSLFFKDSPACMNYDAVDNPAPCEECVLMQLVPPEVRQKSMPCRHIRLNAAGETLDSLHQHAEQPLEEEVYRAWLRATVATLESERAKARAAMKYHPEAHVKTGAEMLFGKLHPKCANPSCPAAFQWLAGGTFFRFNRGTETTGARPAVAPEVRHYWLCESCSRSYTLTFEEGRGIVLDTKWPALGEGESDGPIALGSVARDATS